MRPAIQKRKWKRGNRVPFANTSKGQLHYRLDGPSNGPVIVFSNSLGTNLSMWDPQAETMANRMRVLRYDTRGHGQSPVSPGPYTIDQLGQDVVNLLDALQIERAYFCGLSLGGLTGIWLGINAGQRFHGLVLCNTAARVGTVEAWNGRMAKVKEGGVQAIASAIIDRWFTPVFVGSAPDVVQSTLSMLLSTDAHGYIACCAALRDADLRPQLASIQTPALVISGAHDPVTPPSDGRAISGGIPGGQYVELNASHLSNIEAPQPFTDTVLRFVKQTEAK
jgi:3-oxoadipate enol-lactonase